MPVEKDQESIEQQGEKMINYRLIVILGMLTLCGCATPQLDNGGSFATGRVVDAHKPCLVQYVKVKVGNKQIDALAEVSKPSDVLATGKPVRIFMSREGNIVTQDAADEPIRNCEDWRFSKN